MSRPAASIAVQPRRALIGVALALVLAPMPARGQSLAASQPTGVGASLGAAPRVIARSARAALRVDGRLDEADWALAEPVSGFTQRAPQEGAPATAPTEVRVLFDQDALWIGARMTSPHRDAIQAPVGRRDNIRDMEHFIVSLDTYDDQRTAYTFAVSASGVRGDWHHPRDDERAREMSFDPVWQAAAQVDEGGWTAELRIPFNQLRFNRSGAQQWGVNFQRWVASSNEDDLWVRVPQNVRAWSSRFGVLTGVTGIQPSRRVEALPYVATSSRSNAVRDPSNPFDRGVNLGLRAGGDVKVGLGPNLTLDATVNPDFGQVEEDPAIVNLGAFEVNFPERRPFFVEGAPLFRGHGHTYFYSRRVGAAPLGRAAADYADAPATSTIVGAAKLTGRLPSGLSVGALAALTGRMTAATFDTAFDVGPESRRARDGDADVAPQALYGVARLQQEFGRYRSTAGIVLTAVHRDFPSTIGRTPTAVPLSSLYARDAVVAAGDWNLRLAKGTYELSGSVSASHVAGDSAAILRLQRSSSRFLQRPDGGDTDYDPGRRALSGYAMLLGVEKINGRHWLGRVDLGLRSPGYEINDAGFLALVDRRFIVNRLTYRETTPTRLLQGYDVAFTNQNVWNHHGRLLSEWTQATATATLRNFWRASVTGSLETPTLNAHLTRGGPYMRTYGQRVLQLNVANPDAATRRVSTTASTSWNGAGLRRADASVALSVRPTPRWRLSLTPSYARGEDPRQYIAQLPFGSAATTLDDRYVFATLRYSELRTSFRLDYSVKPDMTLETFFEPFAATGRFSRFGQLAAPGSGELRYYIDDGTASGGTRTLTTGDGETLRVPTRIAGESFATRALRSNVVLRWEWRPGSTFFAVWQQSRDAYAPVGDDGPAASMRDVLDALSGRRNQQLVLKASYWIPVGR